MDWVIVIRSVTKTFHSPNGEVKGNWPYGFVSIVVVDSRILDGHFSFSALSFFLTISARTNRRTSGLLRFGSDALRGRLVPRSVYRPENAVTCVVIFIVWKMGISIDEVLCSFSLGHWILFFNLEISGARFRSIVISSEPAIGLTSSETPRCWIPKAVFPTDVDGAFSFPERTDEGPWYNYY